MGVGRLHPGNAFLPPPGVWLKRKHAYICLVVIWAYTSFWTTMPLVGLGDYAPEPFGTSCTLDWWLAQASEGGQIFILNILFFCLLLPTAVIVFSYVKIIAKVKSSSKEIAHFDSRIHSSHMLEMKLTKVIAVLAYNGVFGSVKTFLCCVPETSQCKIIRMCTCQRKKKRKCTWPQNGRLLLEFLLPLFKPYFTSSGIHVL